MIILMIDHSADEGRAGDQAPPRRRSSQGGVAAVDGSLPDANRLTHRMSSAVRSARTLSQRSGKDIRNQDGFADAEFDFVNWSGSARRIGMPKGAIAHVRDTRGFSREPPDGRRLLISRPYPHARATSSVRTDSDIYSHAIPRKGPRRRAVLGRIMQRSTQAETETFKTVTKHCEADRRTKTTRLVI